ncbi:MAG: hypothetical protein MUF62_10260 [Chitinophagaceae bacterium]|nr:hypothetical protein [Chitinophagaceae bacterium]
MGNIIQIMPQKIIVASKQAEDGNATITKNSRLPDTWQPVSVVRFRSYSASSKGLLMRWYR